LLLSSNVHFQPEEKRIEKGWDLSWYEFGIHNLGSIDETLQALSSRLALFETYHDVPSTSHEVPYSTVRIDILG